MLLYFDVDAFENVATFRSRGTHLQTDVSGLSNMALHVVPSSEIEIVRSHDSTLLNNLCGRRVSQMKRKTIRILIGRPSSNINKAISAAFSR